jgi:hypothetical protein
VVEGIDADKLTQIRVTRLDEPAHAPHPGDPGPNHEAE